MADTNLSNDLLPTIDVLTFLKSAGYLSDTTISTSTPFGPKSVAGSRQMISLLLKLPPSSIERWTDDRVRTAVEQLIIRERTGYDLGAIDGIIGPRTEYALELYQAKSRDITPPVTHITSPAIVKTGTVTPGITLAPISFPRQSDVRRFYGEPNSPDCQALCDNLPYSLRMDGSLSKTANLLLGSTGAPTPIKRVSLHKKLHDSFRSILNETLAHYGRDQIHRLGLDQFAGAFNYRPMRGGTALSMHSWGIAVDFDAQRNTLRETARTARFARPEYKPFIDIFYDHGWISLGRERNFDWMHFQAARL